MIDKCKQDWADTLPEPIRMKNNRQKSLPK